MKKHLFLIALTVLSLSAFAKHVNVETARSVAKTFWTMNVQKGNMMKSSVEFADITSQTEFTNFYIFNTAGGFVIVSADDISTPILGYSNENEFDPTNIPVNAREWLQMYENEIQRGISNGLAASAEVAADWANLQNGMAMQAKGTRAVNKLVQTIWNQSSPYNLLCPTENGQHAVTGCVATAMAQVMKYWNYPTSGAGSKTYVCNNSSVDEDYGDFGTLSVNFANTTYDWNNMLNSYSGSATTAQKNAVATLMYHCGVAVEMSYGINGSGAYTTGNGPTAETAFKTYFLYKNTLQSFGKSRYSDTEWKNKLKTDLNAGRPIIYSGGGSEGGHCFVCDGYDNNDQFHFNWGWGGFCDGFYVLSNLEPGVGGIGAGQGSYTEGQSAIMGIEPSAGLIAIPNSLAFSGLGGSDSFLVRAGSSTSRWSATKSANADWLTITPTQGNGNGANTTVNVTAARNNTANERSATITITHGTETATISVTQPSGLTQDPGCFGTLNNSDGLLGLENGNMAIVRSEGFGYFENGHKVTTVKFTTYWDEDYANNSFTIKIFEGCNDESLSSGYTANVSATLGNSVYTQNYTQQSTGEQVVTLNTPYTIHDNKNFWIAVVANGNSIFTEKEIAFGDRISADEYSRSSLDAYDGKYLYVDTENGINYLNTLHTAYYMDQAHTQIQKFSVDIDLTFCTDDPSTLRVTPETLAFEPEGGNKNFTVRACANVSTSWTAVSDASWLTLSRTTGNGNGATTTVTATATENVSGASRSASITVTHGNQTEIINVTQPDGSIASLNQWYGNSEGGYIATNETGKQIIIRPENYGNYENGNKVLKVKFATCDPNSVVDNNHQPVQTYASYTNTSFTIKIYEGSSMDNNLLTTGSTSAVATCLGTQVYQQNYTASDYGEQIVELTTPYTIHDGTIFWIAVVSNGKTLFLVDYVPTGVIVPLDNYSQAGGIAAASKNYLYTEDNNSVEYLNFDFSASYADNTHTSIEYESMDFVLSYYISDGTTPYVESSDIVAVYLESNTSYYTADETMELFATDDLSVYPVFINNGPEDATESASYSIKIGSEVITSGTKALNGLESGYFTWAISGSTHAYTLTAAQMNERLLCGTFDVCFNAQYTGFDPNASNNTTCITVTRETPTFTINATANPTAGGTITGAGTYNLGAGVTLRATANDGYTFTNWTENGTIVSTDAAYMFTATENRTLVANFTIETYTITASVNPANSGTITGISNPYNAGTNASITATANDGYTFVNWTETIENEVEVSTSATYAFQVYGNRTLVANFSANTYTISVSADPVAGGTATISGNGTYNHGESVTVTATANTGYTFTGWKKNGTIVSNNATYTFNATESCTLVASFTINSYTIAATANPTAGGAVQGTGSYNHGAQVTLTAVAGTGYTFTNWTEGGTTISSEPTLSFTATANRTLVANFSLNSYIIAATADPIAGGSITGAGNYNHGANVTLTASANTGYTFTNWTENGNAVSNNATLSFTATANRNLVAHFTINSYNVTVSANPTEGGNVTGAGQYNHGANVTVTATANNHYSFVNWTENNAEVSTNASYSFAIAASRNLVANFQIDRFDITATSNNAAYGTVTGGGTYNYNATATLTATPTAHYHFVQWNDGNTQNPRTITVTETATYTATFAIDQHTITLVANPTIGGTVTGGGTFDWGTTTTITATAAEGYHFVSWSDDATAPASRSYTVNGNATLTANFVENQAVTYTITASATEGGSINPTGSLVVAGHSNKDYTISANQYYNLTSVLVDGNEAISQLNNGVYSFTDITADHTIRAIFTEIPTYTVATSANPAEGGSTTGNGTFHQGENVSVSATANNHYTFVNWTENNAEVSATATYSFDIAANRNLVANFQIDRFTITTNSNNAEWGTVTGGGEYDYNATATLTATPAAHYHFVSWNDGETNNPRTITVTENATYTAAFAIDTHTIIVTANGNGEVTGGGIKNYGDVITLTATANEGSHFVRWNDGVTESTRQHTVIADAEFIAYFAVDGATMYTVSAEANPTEGGTITGAGQYAENETATLTATANEGYHFLNWAEGTTTLSEEPTLTFVVTSDRNIVANFALNSYTIAATANPTEGGSITGARNYNHGENVTLTATANTGYSFVNWTEGGEVVSSEATLTFVATADRTLVANFEATAAVTYTITATAGNGGTITPEGTVTVVEGENQTFVIRPNEGYQVESISIDGEELVITTVITDSTVYTFNNVTENHTINVTFVNITASEIIEAGSISVFPNPNHGMFSIDFSAIEGNVTYQLINVNGSIIESREMNVSDGSEKSFSYNLAPGVYFVRIISGDKAYTKQVVVE